MNICILRKAAGLGSAVLILAGLLGIASLANAGTKPSAPAPSRPAPAYHPAPASPPSPPSYRPSQPSARPGPSTSRPGPSTSSPRGNAGGFGAQGNRSSTQVGRPTSPRPTVARGTTDRQPPNAKSGD